MRRVLAVAFLLVGSAVAAFGCGSNKPRLPKGPPPEYEEPAVPSPTAAPPPPSPAPPGADAG